MGPNKNSRVKVVAWCHLSLTILICTGSVSAANTRSSAAGGQCAVSGVYECTEAYKSTFNTLINPTSKSLLHGDDAAVIQHMCKTHSRATQCLNNLKSQCPKLGNRADEEARKLHNLTRLCHKMATTDLIEIYSLHQRCLETKTRKSVDECWITFHGDTDGTLSPWNFQRNTVAAQNSAVSSEVRKRKVNLAVCLLHQCLEEALRTKCDDSNTAYEKQASRLVNDLVAPLPPFSIINVNCTAFREEYETFRDREKSTPERLMSRTSSSSWLFSDTKWTRIVLAAITALAILVRV